MSHERVIDDRSQGGLNSNLGTVWRAVTDQVMGGISTGQLQEAEIQARRCLLLTGETRLENNGGFVQVAADLAPQGYFDASAFAGIEIDIFGNDAPYNLHLRTADTRLVWQSYRCTVQATPTWQTLRLPFSGFHPHRLTAALDTRYLRRIGIVSIGSARAVHVAFARLAFFSER